jgi:hypothetical protein
MSYFVRIKSRVFGPFDESQLLEMKSKGKITRVTEISENKNDWQTAEAFPFLYEPAYAAQQSANESADWFYSSNGTEGYGPVTATAIEQMLRSGQLNKNSYVWQQGQTARFIKKEPRFSSPGGATTETTRGATITSGEVTGNGERSNVLDIDRSLAASLGWLMFLKITFLIGQIVQGLCLLGGSLFLISFASVADRVTVFMMVLLSIAIGVGFYALSFKVFLCLWKYHTDLYQAVANGRESDLTKAFQSLFLFWKWASINIIVLLAVILLGTIIGIIISGVGAGWGAGF